MPLTFHIVLALGVIHAVLLLYVLGRNFPQNHLGFFGLIITVIAVTLIIIEEWIVASGAWRNYPHILRISAWMPLLIGPGLWVFVNSLERPDIRTYDYLHFIPALCGLILFGPFYLQSGSSKIDVVLSTHTIPLVVSIFGTAKVVSLFVYFIVIKIRVRQFSRAARAQNLVKYISRLIITIILFLVIIATMFSAEHIAGNLLISSDLAGALGLGIFVYAFSIFSLLHWGNFTKLREPIKPNVEREVASRIQLLDTESSENVFKEVEQIVFAEKLFKISNLQLTRLSEQVGVAPHYLSYVINLVTGRNFNSWLNSLRVEAVRNDLKIRPDTRILEIALDNGFNSKASFNRAFQKEIGISPSEYKNSGLKL